MLCGARMGIAVPQLGVVASGLCCAQYQPLHLAATFLDELQAGVRWISVNRNEDHSLPIGDRSPYDNMADLELNVRGRIIKRINKITEAH